MTPDPTAELAAAAAFSLTDLVAGSLTFLGLVAWGLHATVPWRGPATTREPGGARELSWWWCRGATLVWAVGIWALLLGLSQDPERAWHAGIGPLPAGSLITLWLTLCLAALLGADLLLALARERLERLGWWLAGGLGLLALGVVSWTQELLRTGGLATVDRAGVTLPSLLASSGLRAVLALAAFDLVRVRGNRRAVWSPIAGLALGLYALALTPEHRQLLAAGRDLWTMLAGAGVLVFVPLTPHRLRRVAVGAGLFLAALSLARIARLEVLLDALSALDTLPRDSGHLRLDSTIQPLPR